MQIYISKPIAYQKNNNEKLLQDKKLQDNESEFFAQKKEKINDNSSQKNLFNFPLSKFQNQISSNLTSKIKKANEQKSITNQDGICLYLSNKFIQNASEGNIHSFYDEYIKMSHEVSLKDENINENLEFSFGENWTSFNVFYKKDSVESIISVLKNMEMQNKSSLGCMLIIDDIKMEDEKELCSHAIAVYIEKLARKKQEPFVRITIFDPNLGQDYTADFEYLFHTELSTQGGKRVSHKLLTAEGKKLEKLIDVSPYIKNDEAENKALILAYPSDHTHRKLNAIQNAAQNQENIINIRNKYYIFSDNHQANVDCMTDHNHKFEQNKTEHLLKEIGLKTDVEILNNLIKFVNESDDLTIIMVSLEEFISKNSDPDNIKILKTSVLNKKIITEGQKQIIIDNTPAFKS